jgi:hypothetical protein
MLMMHDAFELRVGSGSVTLDHESEPSDVELIDALDPGRPVEVATKTRLVKAVPFEYGAAWLD